MNADNPPAKPPPILVCFAVKEEAQSFRLRAGGRPQVRILLTGMGGRNAERTVRRALSVEKPALVLTSGFAGGLAPDLPAGTVLFDAGGNTELNAALAAAGAQPGRFLWSARVAAAASEKQALRLSTGADAVEMESQVIASLCREIGIPCATVRIVLDPAGEDLPLDFNALMDANMEMNYGKLTFAVLKSPGKIAALLRLQKASRAAAEKLATVLLQAIAAIPKPTVRP
ncbi:MAG TPA: hypothetical protein VN794_18895 [Methylomirabilota bacterium]|jgi:uridine phosphorylase|nr:hypothetical protein [Methylomirabilota bacterium]